MKSTYGQLKQKITLSLTPVCMARLAILAARNHKSSISDMFEQLVRGKINININYEPTDEEIKSFMVRYKPKELNACEPHEIASHFRKIYFTDQSPSNDIFDLL